MSELVSLTICFYTKNFPKKSGILKNNVIVFVIVYLKTREPATGYHYSNLRKICQREGMIA